MKLRKAAAAILMAGAIIWLTLAALGLAFGLSMRSSLQSGEGIGFIFAALFLALFEVIGFGAAVLALIFAVVAVVALIVLAKARGRGALIAIGVISLLLGSPIGGALILAVAHQEKPQQAR